MGLRPNELSIPRGLSPTARSTSPMTAPIPTTPHRTVRFDLDTTEEDTEAAINEEEDTTWTDREDFLYSDGEDEPEYGGHRAPLLTGIEAPAVTLAMDPTTEEVLEGGRPKSGMGMAFFNMSTGCPICVRFILSSLTQAS